MDPHLGLRRQPVALPILNSSYTQNGAVIILTDAGYNASTPAGGNQSGIGFNASYTGSNPNPATFYLNGQLCN